MGSIRAFTASWLALSLLCLVQPAQAGKYNRKLNIGDAAPSWSDVTGIDGKKHALADLKEAQAVVVVFTCNHCPIATAYEERLKQLQSDFRDRGVQVVAVSVSRSEEDTLELLQARAREREFNFHYLQDLSQELGRQYGAAVTPQALVLDGERKVAYMGAIDDDWQHADNVGVHYVREAVEAVLAGKLPKHTETRHTGCGIEYARKPRNSDVKK